MNGPMFDHPDMDRLSPIKGGGFNFQADKFNANKDTNIYSHHDEFHQRDISFEFEPIQCSRESPPKIRKLKSSFAKFSLEDEDAPAELDAPPVTMKHKVTVQVSNSKQPTFSSTVNGKDCIDLQSMDKGNSALKSILKAGQNRTTAKVCDNYEQSTPKDFESPEPSCHVKSMFYYNNYQDGSKILPHKKELGSDGSFRYKIAQSKKNTVKDSTRVNPAGNSFESFLHKISSSKREVGDQKNNEEVVESPDKVSAFEKIERLPIRSATLVESNLVFEDNEEEEGSTPYRLLQEEPSDKKKLRRPKLKKLASTYSKISSDHNDRVNSARNSTFVGFDSILYSATRQRTSPSRKTAFPLTSTIVDGFSSELKPIQESQVGENLLRSSVCMNTSADLNIEKSKVEESIPPSPGISRPSQFAEQETQVIGTVSNIDQLNNLSMHINTPAEQLSNNISNSSLQINGKETLNTSTLGTIGTQTASQSKQLLLETEGTPRFSCNELGAVNRQDPSNGGDQTKKSRLSKLTKIPLKETNEAPKPYNPLSTLTTDKKPTRVLAERVSKGSTQLVSSIKSRKPLTPHHHGSQATNIVIGTSALQIPQKKSSFGKSGSNSTAGAIPLKNVKKDTLFRAPIDPLHMTNPPSHYTQRDSIIKEDKMEPRGESSPTKQRPNELKNTGQLSSRASSGGYMALSQVIKEILPRHSSNKPTSSTNLKPLSAISTTFSGSRIVRNKPGSRARRSNNGLDGRPPVPTLTKVLTENVQ
jgi:hypothetical protein